MNRLAVATVMLLSLTTPSVAQTPVGAQRHGFWLAVGVGGGSATRCRAIVVAPIQGAAASATPSHSEATPNPRLRVAPNGDTGFATSDTVPLIQTYTALASYYPRLRGGPFLEAGLGLARYSASFHTILYAGNGLGW